MAEMIIRLVIDPDTGKKNIVVKLHSDPDALPLEHEQQHKALVDQLIEGGVLKAGEAGKVIVEREEGEGQAEAPVSKSPEQEKQAQSEGQ